VKVLGIDIGGSGIKGAPVDTKTGEMLGDRYRIKTPEPATPEAVAKTVSEIVRHFEWDGLIGCGFPAVVRRGVTLTAANVDSAWIGTNAADLFEKVTGCRTYLVNDADAAGMAEMTFGAGEDREGVVILITIGTGLGTAIFTDGELVPNTEFGHVPLRKTGQDAEDWASDAARKREELSWKGWAERFDVYLHLMEDLFWPDLFILGGGASKKKKRKKYMEYLTVETPIVPAEMKNRAGIIGAALAAHRMEKRRRKRAKRAKKRKKKGK
jgi:polyphosphate glucokinase